MAAVKFNAGIDLGKSQIVAPRFENLASNAKPSSPVTGQAFYNSTDNRFEVWNGSAWMPADGSNLLGATAPGGSAPGDTAAAGSSALAARLDHRHSRESHTITEHSAFRLDQFAAPNAAVSFGTQKITNLADGTAVGDAVNFGQLESARQARNVKSPVVVKTTGNIALTGTQTIDGIAVVAGNRVLAASQTTDTQNGIYVVAAGAWTRADDADVFGELQDGAEVWVQQGTANGDKIFRQTATLTTFGGQNWVAAGSGGTTYVAGTGLTESPAGTFNVNFGNGVNAGTGDQVAVDPAVVVRKHAQALTGGAASEVVTHNLNTEDVTVEVYLSGGTKAREIFDIRHTSVNTITVISDIGNIPAGTYRVVVHG